MNKIIVKDSSRNEKIRDKRKEKNGNQAAENVKCVYTPDAITVIRAQLNIA